MKGQTLIELLIALSLAGIIAMAVTSLVLVSLNNTHAGKKQSLAAQYTQEGMEIMHQMRDNDYATFTSYSNGTYCLNKGETTLSADCTQPNVDEFIRKVTIAKNSPACNASLSNVTNVVISVAWNDAKCTDNRDPYCHKTSLENCFSDFNQAPTP